jgi:squalene-associated FAD-dependent desaturase
MRLEIVGGGWAGLSAAVNAVQRGWSVTLWEASRHLGGRARTLDHPAGQLDNGQHILIGAYTDTLSLMRNLGLNPDELLHRQPLTLLRPDGHGLRLPDLPAPWNLLLGVCRARGWTWQDRLTLLRCAAQWQRHNFACPVQTTVAELCRRLTARVMDQLIEPLCVSALNTPAREASGVVFLRVLRDALWSGAGSSDLLLPTTDLGALMPDAAARWLTERGVDIRLGCRWTSHQLASSSDALVLACPAWEAARLTAELHPAWSTQAQALRHAPITTVYVQHRDPAFIGLPYPMLALTSHAHHPAQFVLDRGQLFGPSQRGLLACVVSDSTGTRDALERQVVQQLEAQLSHLPASQNRGSEALSDWTVVQTVMEKRATFVCSPALQRPSSAIGQGWWACGDYVEGPYPATLEGAVRSGRQVIDQIAQSRERERRL